MIPKCGSSFTAYFTHNLFLVEKLLFDNPLWYSTQSKIDRTRLSFTKQSHELMLSILLQAHAYSSGPIVSISETNDYDNPFLVTGCINKIPSVKLLGEHFISRTSRHTRTGAYVSVLEPQQSGARILGDWLYQQDTYCGIAQGSLHIADVKTHSCCLICFSSRATKVRWKHPWLLIVSTRYLHWNCLVNTSFQQCQGTLVLVRMLLSLNHSKQVQGSFSLPWCTTILCISWIFLSMVPITLPLSNTFPKGSMILGLHLTC